MHHDGINILMTVDKHYKNMRDSIYLQGNTKLLTDNIKILNFTQLSI